MKTFPTVVASEDGQHRVEVVEFIGSQRVSHRDAVGFYFTIRLEPSGAMTRVGVIFSGTVMVVSPVAFGLPDEGDREANFINFSLAALGDHIDDEGLPPVVESGEAAHHIECFSPHFQEWADRTPAGDNDIEAYLRAHVFATWEYGGDDWEFGTSDLIRLHQDMRTAQRLVALGENEEWQVVAREDGLVRLEPTSGFIRGMRGGGLEPSEKPEQMEHPEDEGSEHPQDDAPRFVYVDESRIAELRGIASDDFDLRKLVAICEELNVCYRSQCYHAVAALTRALMDHIPPLLDQASFSEVANNYGGSRSFKDCMQRLEGAARKIADGHLHTQVRASEALPTRTQVNFSNEVDLLLAEIVRVIN